MFSYNNNNFIPFFLSFYNLIVQRPNFYSRGFPPRFSYVIPFFSRRIKRFLIGRTQALGIRFFWKKKNEIPNTESVSDIESIKKIFFFSRRGSNDDENGIDDTYVCMCFSKKSGINRTGRVMWQIWLTYWQIHAFTILLFLTCSFLVCHKSPFFFPYYLFIWFSRLGFPHSSNWSFLIMTNWKVYAFINLSRPAMQSSF